MVSELSNRSRVYSSKSLKSDQKYCRSLIIQIGMSFIMVVVQFIRVVSPSRTVTFAGSDMNTLPIAPVEND